ncbi:MAG: hypothetical protein PHR68_03485 [Candidatus Gracilibacteria bacterium]|nr:hypothetical protein [Candidatus Gracilibacteria bacterium]
MAENDINESNIFKELSGELDFGNIQNVDNNGNLEKKDANYYMKLSSKILMYVNIGFFTLLLILFSYIKIEQNDTLLENSYINPICYFLLGGETSSLVGDCSSVSALSNKYNNSIKDLKTSATNKIIEISSPLFAIKNFTLSKDVKFIIDKNQTKIKPLVIFEEFDKIKNAFTSRDKGQIQCQNISMDNDFNFSINCTAYTSDWNTSIPTAEVGKKVSGTSISLAANFINYLEKNSTNFEIINKPKSFSIQNYSGNGYYTKKTDFNLTLKYRDNNINNF